MNAVACALPERRRVYLLVLYSHNTYAVLTVICVCTLRPYIYSTGGDLWILPIDAILCVA